MTSLREKLMKAKNKLQKVQTRVTLENGATLEEEKDEDGEFKVIFRDDDANESTKFPPLNATTNMQKSMNKAARCGYVLDFSPDLQIARIIDGIYLSSQDVAQDFQLLKKTGITHIVNVATGIRNMFVDHFTYLSITALDCPSQNLKKHFNKSLGFMKQAVSSGGKVLVHCNAGISRSTTLVIAYLMKFEQQSFADAFSHVRSVRAVARPNDGFIDQLKEFERELRFCRES